MPDDILQNPTRKFVLSLYWRCQLLGWTLHSFSYFFPKALFGFGRTELLMLVVTVVTGLPISHLMYLTLVKFKITEKTVRTQIIDFLAITLLFGLIEASAWLILISQFEHQFFTEPNFWARYIQLYSEMFFLFLTWNFIYFAYHYIKNARKKDKEKIDIQLKLIELKAFALRSQMNPHFIFNCLNSIKALIQEKEDEKAITYLTTFSKLIRTIFQNADKREITLFDEIETCKLYVQMESMRFEKKLNYHFRVDPTVDLKSVMVPSLTIQPFIENAVWHGIMPKEGDGNLIVSVEKKDGEIDCIIDDDGIGRETSMQNKFKAGTLFHESKGVHLTQMRLKVDNKLNERNASVEIIDKKDETGNSLGTRVILKFSED